ncbi:hypothetical protein Vadar_027578 [Vaccinium darrowii]|uniref:Uncharacterized protein n=1 Tax=Vaccinium darrowii TaxID=229202 RepID=A0ACB7XCU9_9ERIC|nr:hypothetical protein Vadar_027578 [Vaccinium darrowii]
MCLARDRDSANPFRVATMRGKVKILDVLFQANPHAARARIIDLVLNKTKIDVNATNAIKQTAMDIHFLRQGTEPEGADRDIEDLLLKFHAKREKDTIDPKWITDQRNALIIVAVLLATIAFQAGVTPPGGV